MRLYRHQTEAIREAVQVLRKSGGFYLAHDPGMGKTLTFIAASRILDAKRVLVLAPVVALGVWDNSDPDSPGELQRWWPTANTVTLREDAWRVEYPKKSSDPGSSPTIFLTNYDQIVGKYGKIRLRKLLKMQFDVLILDEAHYIKNPTSQRTRAVFRLAAKARYSLLGSGTPSHSPLDWWSQFRIVAPHEPMWSQRYSGYKRLIAFMGGPTGNWVKGFNPESKQDAAKAIRPYTHVAKSEVLKLPEPIFTPVPVELSAEERAYYQQMENLLFVEIDGEEVMSARIVLTKILRLQQIAAGHLGEHGIGSTKLRACLELLGQRERQKVIVAASFDWELDQLEAAVKASGRPYMVIRGRTPPEERRRTQTEFQSVDRPFVLLMNYRAGGVALTLTRADAAIPYSIGSSLIVWQQFVGRFFRIGTTTHVQVLPLIARGTVDEDIWKGLQRKAIEDDMAKLISDGIKRRAA